MTVDVGYGGTGGHGKACEPRLSGLIRCRTTNIQNTLHPRIKLVQALLPLCRDAPTEGVYNKSGMIILLGGTLLPADVAYTVLFCSQRNANRHLPDQER